MKTIEYIAEDNGNSIDRRLKNSGFTIPTTPTFREETCDGVMKNCPIPQTTSVYERQREGKKGRDKVTIVTSTFQEREYDVGVVHVVRTKYREIRDILPEKNQENIPEWILNLVLKNRNLAEASF